MAVNFGYITNAVIARYFLYSRSGDHHYTRKSINKFWYVYIFVYIRVSIYVVIFLINLIFIPCHIRSILSQRRRRHSLLQEIRRSRASYAYPMQEENLNQPLLPEYQRQNNPYPVPLPPPQLSENLPYAPVSEHEFQRSESYHDRFMDIFHHQENNEPLDGRSLELLNRVNYQNEKDRLPHNECSICLQALSEYQNERLIYLPCNRQHIYHSK
mmetsp:Transcript_9045/g.10231  ORF Transcript_9045/g.10231 Transcript_9045/m.10231 type:complete len:213 (+) Transcript_9045:290-928(+)